MSASKPDLSKVKTILEKFLKPPRGSGVLLNSRAYILLVFAQESYEFSKTTLIPKLNKIYASAKSKVNCEFVYVGCDENKAAFDKMDDVAFQKIPFDDNARRELIDVFMPTGGWKSALCPILDYHPSLLQLSKTDASDLVIKDKEDDSSFPYLELGVSMKHVAAAACGPCSIL